MTTGPGPFEGLHNFRDLGGVRTTDGRMVATGRVYRSDALHRMTPTDVATVSGLGVVSVIDLRAPDEVAHVGTGPVAGLGAAYHNLPVRPAVLTAPDGPALPPAPTAAEHYFRYLAEGPACFRGVMEVLSGPAALPAVFFCNAGKDRTGVVAAMVLTLLGVPDDVVAADYARTQPALAAIATVSRRDYPADVGAWRRLSPDLAEARAGTMLTFLALVRERVGGFGPYLAGLGVDPAHLDALRANLLTDPENSGTTETPETPEEP